MIRDLLDGADAHPRPRRATRTASPAPSPRTSTALGLAHRSDRLGNLMCTLPGDPRLPSVMVFAHMDQLGFIVRKIEPSGLIRLERQGGVPGACAAGAGRACSAPRQGDLPGVIANKSHHATTPGREVPGRALRRAGRGRRLRLEGGGRGGRRPRSARPSTYLPRALELAGGRIAGTAVDDRAGCAALLALAEARQGKPGPTLHLVWSVQEEHNLRGVLPAATALAPDIAISDRPAARLRHARDGRRAATSRSAAARPCRCSRSTGAARSTASSRTRRSCG